VTKRAYKRFERSERDFYETPKEAVKPLWSHLKERGDTNFSFCDPCAGFMAIPRHLHNLSDGSVTCSLALDINEQTPRTVQVMDTTQLPQDVVTYSGATKIITNPPWSRPTLHKMIEVFSDICDTWLLFDADWLHTKQSVPYLTRLRTVVSVGRVKWIAESSGVGFDNCAWYRFGNPMRGNVIEFVGRISSD
jgi:hypothetical protein